MTATTRLLTALAASAITLVGFTPTPVSAGTFATNQHEFIHRRAGKTTPEARSVGSIVGGWTETGGFIARGSGVLIGGRYVLTAAHLVDDMTPGATFTINGQNYGMQRWVVSNRFYSRDPTTGNPDARAFGVGGDLALVQLDRRVVGARNLRAKMNTRRNEAGKTATIVGFGRGGDGAVGINTPAPGTGALIPDTPVPNEAGFGTDDAGVWNFQPVKRAGKNVVEAHSPFARRTNRELVTDFDAAPDQLPALAAAGLQPPQFDPFTGTYNIDEDDIPISNEFAPSVGDSGGGLFINGKLAGITSWTTRANSEFFSQANYTRLSRGGWRWARDNIRAFNNFLANPNPEPWRTVAKGGSGFRGVAKIFAAADVGDGSVIAQGDTINIFGPRLFFDETGAKFTVEMDVSNRFIFNDLNADPAPLSDLIANNTVPEPASLALLTLGGLTLLRRKRR